MVRRKASDYEPEMLALLDQFVRGDISRRQVTDRAAAFTPLRFGPDAASLAWSRKLELVGQHLR